MRFLKDEEIEVLLTREARSQLPLARLLVLYLDPFALFKDTSRGPASVRQRALYYNRAMRWMLIPYIRRWLVIGGALLLAIEPTQALAANFPFFIIPAAACAVGSCFAVTIIAWIAVAYLFLALRE
jgi:hypothetical protein